MGRTGVTIFDEIVPKWEASKYADQGKLVRPEKFELPTYSSGGCRSIQLSYGRAADSSSVHRLHRRLNDWGQVGIPVENRLAPSLTCSIPGDKPSPVSTVSTTISNSCNHPSTVAIEPRFRLFDCRTFLRSRRDFGVTSTNSSSAMNSIACSRLRLRYGTRRIASSEVDARMLVSFFSRTMFTSRSVSFAFSPMIMPS